MRDRSCHSKWDMVHRAKKKKEKKITQLKTSNRIGEPPISLPATEPVVEMGAETHLEYDMEIRLAIETGRPPIDFAANEAGGRNRGW